MKKSDWQKVMAARDLLGLEERATFKQIKGAYRRLSKKHHPDLEGHDGGGKEKAGPTMQEINRAYQVLEEFVSTYSFPLSPENSEQPLEAEDWWMDRFGQDPLWGKNRDES